MIYNFEYLLKDVVKYKTINEIEEKILKDYLHENKDVVVINKKSNIKINSGKYNLCVQVIRNHNIEVDTINILINENITKNIAYNNQHYKLSDKFLGINNNIEPKKEIYGLGALGHLTLIIIFIFLSYQSWQGFEYFMDIDHASNILATTFLCIALIIVLCIPISFVKMIIKLLDLNFGIFNYYIANQRQIDKYEKQEKLKQSNLEFLNDIYENEFKELKRGYDFINFEESNDKNIVLKIPNNFIKNNSENKVNLDDFCSSPKLNENELNEVFKSIKYVKEEVKLNNKLKLAEELRNANDYKSLKNNELNILELKKEIKNNKIKIPDVIKIK